MLRAVSLLGDWPTLERPWPAIHTQKPVSGRVLDVIHIRGAQSEMRPMPDVLFISSTHACIAAQGPAQCVLARRAPRATGTLPLGARQSSLPQGRAPHAVFSAIARQLTHHWPRRSR
ncbi:hypothetical protein WOLCODRAFT_153004 [Wolfiporia cocos MD-104 SS10]|uniref:Uncharacterized protein n=1 Tax=Wolfiporia cocos (strain MD-104) TaxID=742152 RepID=A0A2H3JSS1_WOLCO|nr:hypothetical protein WOLCODRAFT_153004 [Wolfiporia cocos MD-104 SS10]